MSRRDFGAWGIELDDDDFACALAALGVLWGEAGEFHATGDLARFEASLTEALENAVTPVSWALSFEFGRLSSATSTSARTLAQAWRAVGHELAQRPRIELTWASQRAGGAHWIAEQLARPAVGAESVYVRQDRPEADVSWSWPLRLGFLADPVSDQLRHEILANRWHPAISELVTVPAPGVECDLLLLPFSLRGALLNALDSPTPLRASCVVVLGGTGGATAPVVSRVFSLRAETGTAGVVVAEVDGPERVRWLNILMTELAHGTPIDAAVARASGEAKAPPPFFVASRRLIVAASVPAGGAALLRDLERSHEGHPIPLGVMSHHARSRLLIDPHALEASVRDLRDGFAKLLPHLVLDHEYDDATTIAELARAFRDGAGRLDRPARHLQARMFDLGDRASAPTPALRAGAPHRIDVRIAVGEAAWATLAERFPEEKLPPAQAAHTLTVVLTDPRLVPRPQVATIVLPADGKSETASFFVFAPLEGVDRMDARVTVLHRNRVLQTARLRAAVVHDPAEAGEADRLALEPETFVSLDLADLGARRPFDAAIVLNHTGGEAQATAFAGEYASLIALRNIDTVVSKIADQLSKLAWKQEAFASLDAEATRQLFFFLASQGSLLHKAILDGTSPQLWRTLGEARTVQIVAAKRGDMIPLELAYAFAAPRKGAEVCQEGCKALAAGATRCPAGCEKGNDAVVCPLGFWGLSRVIERQSDGLLPLAGTGADFGIRLVPGARRRIEILRSAVFGASSRADAGAAGSSDAVRDALAEVTRQPLTPAASWDAWREQVKASPSLLALLVHVERDKEADLQAIEIGKEDMLLVSQISDAYVRGDPAAQPVVLLVGCRTSLSDVEFQQFPVQFQRAGAALVLGTVATVLGSRAGPIMATLVRTIADMTARGDVPFGEALLAAKQALVARGELMAMCLCAHGDADWILGAPRAAST